jgi:hypothetical protein
MNEYALIIKGECREILNKVKCSNEDDAAKYFAKIKRIDVDQLIRLFDIVSITQ